MTSSNNVDVMWWNTDLGGVPYLGQPSIPVPITGNSTSICHTDGVVLSQRGGGGFSNLVRLWDYSTGELIASIDNVALGVSANGAAEGTDGRFYLGNGHIWSLNTDGTTNYLRANQTPDFAAITDYTQISGDFIYTRNRLGVSSATFTDSVSRYDLSTGAKESEHVFQWPAAWAGVGGVGLTLLWFSMSPNRRHAVITWQSNLNPAVQIVKTYDYDESTDTPTEVREDNYFSVSVKAALIDNAGKTFVLRGTGGSGTSVVINTPDGTTTNITPVNLSSQSASSFFIYDNARICVAGNGAGAHPRGMYFLDLDGNFLGSAEYPVAGQPKAYAKDGVVLTIGPPAFI